MRLGVLSDSHDHMHHLERAVDLLLARSITAWIHLGDFVAPFVAPQLLRLPKERHLLWGNNDGERPGLLGALGAIRAGPCELKLSGRDCMAMHEPYALEAAIHSGRYDIVLYGHTHQVDVRRVQRTLVLNPGEVCGWVTGVPTCAIVDTETLRAEVLTVFGDPVDMPAR